MLRAAALLLAFAAPAAADVLDEIAERGTVRIGVREFAAPFSHRDAEGEPAGVAVELCLRAVDWIADAVDRDLTVEPVFVSAATRFEKVLAGEVDIHCGPATATLGRRETLDFSITYFLDGVSAAVRRGGVEDPGKLDGEPVGALRGTTGVDTAAAWAEPAGSPVVEFEEHRDGLVALGAGEIDVYFGDQGLILAQLGALKAEDASIPVRILADQFSYEPYALAMKRGETRLRLVVDRALSEMFLSQEVFDVLQGELGDFEVSDLAAALYVLVALPE